MPIIILTLLILISCGSPPQPAKPIQKYQFVSIKLLVAPWCDPCRKELNHFSVAEYDRTHIFLDAVSQTGISPQSKPDEESANSMSVPKVPVRPDGAKWKSYKEYFPGMTYELPKAVVFGENEKCAGKTCEIESTLIKTFQGVYSAEEVLIFAKSAL